MAKLFIKKIDNQLSDLVAFHCLRISESSELAQTRTTLADGFSFASHWGLLVYDNKKKETILAR